ncbi:amidohydrolase [Clostridium sp.]|uniref:amidohydrolase n=1 Tax=Clostridium sp. TaxID=1506 RepID=UPI002FCBCA5A
MSILINNVSIITMDGKDNILNKGYILISGNTIEKVESGEYEGPITSLKVIDGEGCIAMPGLINMHTHVPMTLLRGYGEGLPLMKWLNERIFPFEAKMTKDDVYIGSLLGIVEMIKSGTTTFVDMYYKLSEIANAAKDMNIRAFLGNTIIGDDYKKQIDKTISLKESIQSDLVNITLAPHSPYTCSTEALIMVSEAGRVNNIPIQIHLSESREEIDTIKASHKVSPIKYCNDIGLFEGNKVIAAHCIHIDEDDMKILKDNKVAMVVNPQSNMKLASGTAPAIDAKRKGVNICLGTDGPSSNNSLNMVEEMKVFSLVQKLFNSDANVMDPYTTLEIATVNGAKALGMEDSLGKIKEGYLADIILIDTKKPHLTPCFNYYANIVYSAQGSDIKTSIINGKIVMKDYKIKLVDETILMERAQNAVNSILSRLK